MTDADAMARLTDDEQALATADNAPLWRELAILRLVADEVVRKCERLDRLGASRAIDVDFLRRMAALLPNKPVVAGDVADAHRFYTKPGAT